MTVYLLGAGPGDPGLLTVRGAEVLARADVVVYDRLVDPSLLLLAPRGAELVDVGKVPGAGHTPEGARRQRDINDLLVQRSRSAGVVVRLKGGDPFVFGRGGEEAEALEEAGVDWEVVPGVSSAFAVPAAAGIPVTHRGLSTSATVVTGHVGDPSAAGGVDWESLGRLGGTIVVLMGMATRDEIARRLMDAGRPAATPVAVVAWGTTPGQRVVRTTLGDLASVELGSPAVIVIGEVAGLGIGRDRSRRPLEGVTVVVTRPLDRAAPAPALRSHAPASGAAGTAGIDATRPGAPEGRTPELSEALRASGARVLAVPTIEIADPDDGGAALSAAAARAGEYRWVVFTSQHAVERLFDRLDDVRALANVRVAAVGPATAAALAARHVRADLVPVTGRSNAEGLVAAFPPPDLSDAPGPPDAPGAPDHPGARVLFPAAARARATVPEGLRAKGWSVDEVVAYRTVPAPAPPDAVLGAVASASAVTFSSPSALDAYLAMRTAAGRPLPVAPVVVCVGPLTAKAAHAAGLAGVVEVPVADPGAAVAAIAAALARGAGTPTPP